MKLRYLSLSALFLLNACNDDIKVIKGPITQKYEENAEALSRVADKESEIAKVLEEKSAKDKLAEFLKLIQDTSSSSPVRIQSKISILGPIGRTTDNQTTIIGAISYDVLNYDIFKQISVDYPALVHVNNGIITLKRGTTLPIKEWVISARVLELKSNETLRTEGSDLYLFTDFLSLDGVISTNDTRDINSTNLQVLRSGKLNVSSVLLYNAGLGRLISSTQYKPITTKEDLKNIIRELGSVPESEIGSVEKLFQNSASYFATIPIENIKQKGITTQKENVLGLGKNMDELGTAFAKAAIDTLGRKPLADLDPELSNGIKKWKESKSDAGFDADLNNQDFTRALKGLYFKPYAPTTENWHQFPTYLVQKACIPYCDHNKFVRPPQWNLEWQAIVTTETQSISKETAHVVIDNEINPVIKAPTFILRFDNPEPAISNISISELKSTIPLDETILPDTIKEIEVNSSVILSDELKSITLQRKVTQNLSIRAENISDKSKVTIDSNKVVDLEVSTKQVPIQYVSEENWPHYLPSPSVKIKNSPKKNNTNPLRLFDNGLTMKRVLSSLDLQLKEIIAPRLKALSQYEALKSEAEKSPSN